MPVNQIRVALPASLSPQHVDTDVETQGVKGVSCPLSPHPQQTHHAPRSTHHAPTHHRPLLRHGPPVGNRGDLGCRVPLSTPPAWGCPASRAWSLGHEQRTTFPPGKDGGSAFCACLESSATPIKRMQPAREFQLARDPPLLFCHVKSNLGRRSRCHCPSYSQQLDSEKESRA